MVSLTIKLVLSPYLNGGSELVELPKRFAVMPRLDIEKDGKNVMQNERTKSTNRLLVGIIISFTLLTKKNNLKRRYSKM